MKSVKEIASQLGVTTQTVRNEVKRQSITVVQNKNQHLIKDEDIDRISSAISERKNAKPSEKVIKNKRQTDDLVAVLQSEISTKNRQIEFLQNENARLADAVAELTNSLKAIQALQVLQSGKVESIEQHEDPVKRWWMFWK